MALEYLRTILPPPPVPVETAGTEDWPKIESTLGTELPQDYKDYVNLYGTGGISNNFLWPLNPFSANSNINLTDQIPLILDGLRRMKEEFGAEACPYPLFPAIGGLLPWGNTSNGNTLFWRTTGKPEEWTVVISDSDGIEYEHFHESMSRFLAELLIGKITSDFFPVNYVSKHISFEVGHRR